MSCKPGCPLCERLRLLALQIVGVGGIEALSLHALSERAGLPLGRVCDHYATAADCLCATYDELSFSLFVDLASAFAEPPRWQSGFVVAHERVLARLAAHPAEARLCFVEAHRGNHELRRRRATTRRWVVELVAGELERRGVQETLSQLQIEMLVGATAHAITAVVGDGRASELPALAPKLHELLDVFTPIVA
jgi:AcrR family transcriptional regulator